MPEGKEIEFADGEYPELDGLQPGSEVKFTGSATIEDHGNGQKGLMIKSMEFETEGPADREMRNMRGDQSQTPAPGPNEASEGEDF